MKTFFEFLSENQNNYPFVRVEKNEFQLTAATGESGDGIYFSLTKYPQMLKYYKDMTEDGYRIIYAKPKPNCQIHDFTNPVNLKDLIQFMKIEIEELSKRMIGYRKPNINTSNYQRYGNLIQDYIRKHKLDLSGYIVNHEYKNFIPTGKQLIITKEDDFEYFE